MFVTDYQPPEKRRPYAEGGIERRMTEAAVMLAFALHLLDAADGEAMVTVHPDGEHAKVFGIQQCLETAGFNRVEAVGKTTYGGRYVREEHTIVVNPTSGKGDVVGEIGGQRIIAECKGAVINSKHSGQRSRTRKGLSELIGQLIILPEDGARHIAVIPETYDTARLAPILARRCVRVGIEIALVQPDGKIALVSFD